MGLKTAAVRHEGGLRFVARTGSGHELAMDNATGDTAPRPTEVLLAALGACTAMDVVSILAKKRQVVESYAVQLEGLQREGTPNVYVRVDIVHEVVGAVDRVALARAIELSAHRYCTVSAQLASGPAEIHHRYVLRSEADGPEESAEVCVTGPRREEAELPA